MKGNTKINTQIITPVYKSNMHVFYGLRIDEE